ncbi:hypothetical protein [Chitinophaga barathri]|uniref:Uncharacterized protein n=1 Tax=Chitinophaga barathri TaxID=1647451 RepID=A0A3N4MU47_9BACT|nr:hypothetical protein [Chitinophaga barathri]RPD43079.1 hypothetical protein EG028_01950 [Chitinophaga barathri]
MYRFFTYHHNATPADLHEGGYFHAGYPDINQAMLDFLLAVRYDSLRIKPTDSADDFRKTSIYDQRGWRLASVYMDEHRNLRLELTPAEPNPVEGWLIDAPTASLFVAFHLESRNWLLASPGTDNVYQMSDRMVEMMNVARMYYDPNSFPYQQQGFLVERRGYRVVQPGTLEKDSEFLQLFDYFSSRQNALASFNFQKGAQGHSRHYGPFALMESRLISIPDKTTLFQSDGFGSWNPGLFVKDPHPQHFGFLRHRDPEYHPWSGQSMDYAVSVNGDLVDPHDPQMAVQPRVRFSSTLHLQSQTHAMDTFLNFDPRLLQDTSFRRYAQAFACERVQLVDRRTEVKLMAEIARGGQLTIPDQNNELQPMPSQTTYLIFNAKFHHMMPKTFTDKFPPKISEDGGKVFISEIARRSNHELLYNHTAVHALSVLSLRRQPDNAEIPYIPYRACVTYIPSGTARDQNPESFQVYFRLNDLTRLSSLLANIPQGITADFGPIRTPPQPISVTVINSNGLQPILHLTKQGGMSDLLVMAPAYIPAPIVEDLTAIYRGKYTMVDGPDKLFELIAGGSEAIAEQVRKTNESDPSQQRRMSR